MSFSPNENPDLDLFLMSERNKWVRALENPGKVETIEGLLKVYESVKGFREFDKLNDSVYPGFSPIGIGPDSNDALYAYRCGNEGLIFAGKPKITQYVSNDEMGSPKPVDRHISYSCGSCKEILFVREIDPIVRIC